MTDKATEDFLVSLGFTLNKSCAESMWSGHGLFFSINENVIITTLGQLLTYFTDTKYQDGYSHGKAAATAMLYEKMNELVFPSPEQNYNKLTVE
jgi:hypothetical protein